MTILFDHHEPFFLAHGGLQVQIEQSFRALKESGLQVEHLRWWDPDQSGDILHFFGIPPLHAVERAKAKGMRVVITHLLTTTCNRPRQKLLIQAACTRVLSRSPVGRALSDRLGWSSLRSADAVVVGLKAEAEIMKLVWEVKKIFVAPLGLNPAFLGERDHDQSPACDLPAGQFLINVGTICERKRTVELARMAAEAKVPVLFVGKPFSPEDSYWKQFQSMVDGCYVWHHPHMDSPSQLAALYHSAIGYVHLCGEENWCLTAHEAAACGLKLLLPNRPWSRECFHQQADYFAGRTFSQKALELRSFHAMCAASKTRWEYVNALYDWGSVASELICIYRSLGPSNPAFTVGRSQP